MSSEVIIPALGESIATGILSSWKVSDGSYVEIDQPIYDLETDKITQEGLAEVSGVIAFLAQEGDEVEIGATIAKIEETAEKTVHAPSGTNPTIDDKFLNFRLINIRYQFIFPFVQFFKLFFTYLYTHVFH